MNIIERGKAFVQHLCELANRSAWDWHRCGSTDTAKNGDRRVHPWTSDGKMPSQLLIAGHQHAVKVVNTRWNRVRCSSDAYWQVGKAVSGVHRVLDRAWDFTRAGDGRNAPVVLETITEELLAGFESLDDSYGDVGDFFRELGPAWAEALLSAELTSEER